MDTIADNVQPIRFYRPDYHIKTPEMRSPEYVQMSTAAAITLGLVAGKMHRTACTHCLNLLVTYPEGCRANCAYCGLARHREEARDYADRNFIRVDWPTARYDEVIERVKAGADKGQFQRMCISMITHPNSNADTFVLLERWARIDDYEVEILSSDIDSQILESAHRGALHARPCGSHRASIYGRNCVWVGACRRWPRVSPTGRGGDRVSVAGCDGNTPA